jgi:hypothetical protein
MSKDIYDALIKQNPGPVGNALACAKHNEEQYKQIADEQRARAEKAEALIGLIDSMMPVADSVDDPDVQRDIASINDLLDAFLRPNGASDV